MKGSRTPCRGVKMTYSDWVFFTKGVDSRFRNERYWVKRVSMVIDLRESED